MTTQTFSQSNYSRRGVPIRLGYVRLLDAAPLIIADSLGMFRDADLSVELTREVGWATIRDKLAFGQLDVAQALSPMPFVMQLGIHVAKTEVITGMVLNCNGNAITLSKQLREEGIKDGVDLRRYIKKGFRPRKIVFGVVSHASSHHFMLCRWLEEHGLCPHKDVIISVLPPEQMVRNMASQNIDGFCVGEPWNSLAVEEALGFCVTTSEAIASGYPEKVLATTERFNTYRGEEYQRMIEVLRDACAYCDQADRRKEMLNILSKPGYLNCSPKTLSNALSGNFPMGYGNFSAGQFIRFSGDEVNRPDPQRAKSVYEDLIRYLPGRKLEPIPAKTISRIFRASIYQQAASQHAL
ncbi:MAG: nitrate ABC transporter ATP-binding protein [Puniceicoccaceae bacterium]|nr:MAG: nitrate ABC transporter ATP-binding protein [Puniceicoccaceae bacterium]